MINNMINLFDEITLTSTAIEKQICNFSMKFEQVRNEKIEWQIKLPMFVIAFYNYIITKNSIPSQDDYLQFYVSENKEYLTNLNLTMEEKIGVRARVYRTYPSLIRDLHFGLYLKERNCFSSVFYNVILDIEYGIDLLIQKPNGVFIGLNLFTKTKAAEHARAVKEFRAKKAFDYTCYEIPIDFRGSKVCGNYFLYSEREIGTIVDKIHQLEEK